MLQHLTDSRSRHLATMELALSKQELMQVTPSAERHTLAVLQGRRGQVSQLCDGAAHFRHDFHNRRDKLETSLPPTVPSAQVRF